MSLAKQPVFYPVITTASLRPGETTVIRLNKTSVLICNIAGRFHAVENQCSHLQMPLDRARIRDGLILCPVHGAKFDPETGEPRCPPAIEPLSVYATRIVDGWLEIAPGAGKGEGGLL